MMRKVSMFLLFFLVLFLLLGLSGCMETEGNVHQTSGEPGQELVGGEPAGLRPEKYWEGAWKIKEKECVLETDGDQAILKAYCFLEYQGEDPAEDVQIMLRSPLSEKLTGDDPAENFGTINSGEEIEYRLSLAYPAWQEALSAGCSEENLIEDFTLNSYIDITWSYGEQRYNVQFYDWSEEFPVS